MFLEFNALDLPTGKWESAYGKQIGLCAKRIDINVKEYLKMGKVEKDNYWEETKRKFHIEDPNGVREKKFHRALGARFRCHKSKLRARFIYLTNPYPPNSPKAHMKPWEVYEGYFTEEQWKEFEVYTNAAEFKVKSEKGKESAQKNKCPHHLGQNSYGRARKKWENDKRLPISELSGTENESSASITSVFDARSLQWLLAREKRMPGGTWAVDPKESETARVAALVKENLEKQAKEKEEGSVVVDRVDRGIDALAMAFGKKDHSGFVKGLGGCGIGVGFAKAFGPSNRKGKRFEGCPYEELEVMKAKLAHDFEARFSERVAEEVQAYLAALIPNFTSVMMPSKNDLHVAYSNALSNQVNETSCPLYPRHFELEVATKCHLALNDEFNGNLVFVAEEKVQPCPNGVTHNNKMKSDHYRVSVDYIYSEYALLDLPVTTDDGISKLGEAKGYFVEWPKDLVVFEEKDHGSSLFDRHRSSLFMNHVID